MPNDIVYTMTSSVAMVARALLFGYGTPIPTKLLSDAAARQITLASCFILGTTV